MDEQNLLIKINSKYICEIINSYINSFNFIYQLIVHCKSAQKRFNVNLSNYKELFYYKKLNLSKFSGDTYFLNLLKKIFRREDEESLKRFVTSYFLKNKPNIYENSFILRLELPLSDVILKSDSIQYLLFLFLYYI